MVPTVLLLLLACRAEVPDPTDAADFESSSRAEWVWSTTFFPGFLPLYVASWAVSQPECPAVAATAEGAWSAEGECASASATYYGFGKGQGVFATEPRLRSPFSAHWDGFGWYAEDVGSILASGDLQNDGSTGLGDLTATDFVASGGVHGNEYDIEYTSWNVVNYGGLTGDRTEFQLNAEVITDLGGAPSEQVLTATGQYSEGCTREFGSGTLTATGNDHWVEYVFDGATACDGCIGWETDGGLTGNLCFGAG